MENWETTQQQPEFSQTPPRSNAMSVAAMTLGIISIVSLCCSGMGIPIAGLGIVLALLSRRGRHMNTQAKVGLGLSIGGLVLSALVLIVTTVTILSSGAVSKLEELMNEYDISTTTGQQEFMDEWESYIYEEVLPATPTE